MKKFDVSEQMAQGAAVWNEREQHAAVMEKLKKIDYETDSYIVPEDCGDYYAGENIVTYRVTSPSDAELVEIINRGNHDEIMYMISRFHKLLDFSRTHYDGYIPAAVQKALIKRNNAEEITAVTDRYGFCEEAQETMFECWPQEQLIAYSRKHGFTEKGQQSVLKNWPRNEASEYIRRHGLKTFGIGFLIDNGWHDELMLQISTHGFDNAWLPELVDRGNHEEIMAALAVCNRYRSPVPPIKPHEPEEWFDSLLQRGNHDEILAAIRCLSAEAFSDERQLAIWKRMDCDEIAAMCRQTELSQIILKAMFSAVEAGQTNEFFKIYAQNSAKGLPVPYQVRFINVANSQDFALYISHHGFYEEVLVEMVAQRSIEDIRLYLKRHCFLSDMARKLFLLKMPAEDILFYYEHSDTRHAKALLNDLLTMRPLNYDVLTSIFLKMPSGWKDDVSEINLMRTGSPEEIRAYFKTVKSLCRRAFITLFFRMDKALFEDYLSNRTEFFC